MRTQRGYTILELVIAVVFVAAAAGVIGMLWVLAHFLAKYW